MLHIRNGTLFCYKLHEVELREDYAKSKKPDTKCDILHDTLNMVDLQNRKSQRQKAD